jgi:hypothetical protein
MTQDASPVLLQSEHDAATQRRKPNGWELALWIVGALLLLGGGVLIFGFVRSIVGINSNPSPNVLAASDLVLQTSTTLAPAMITGGIVCIALALLARAIDVNALRREATRVPVSANRVNSDQNPVEPIPPTPAPPIRPDAPVAAPAAEPITDFTPFMRPSVDARDGDDKHSDA